MAEISNVRSRLRSVASQTERKIDRTSDNKKKEAVPDQTDLQAATVQIKTQRLELLFSAQKESKTTFSWQNGFRERAAARGVDIGQLQYNGKPIMEMSQEEAAALVADDGYFGVAKTSQRLADFVLAGGGDDLGRLQSGREGIIKGFKEAEEIWGGHLPEISYQTLDKALALIDARIGELGGGSLVDVQA